MHSTISYDFFLAFFSGLISFFLSLSLFFWWISRSSSVSLLMVLVFSVLSVVVYSFSSGFKVPLFMVVLTLSGGLFVLISFVIMFFPGDYKDEVIYSRGIYFFVFFSLFLSFFFSFKKEGVVFWNLGGVEFEGKVWGNFFFVYIFLIILLFLYLFLVNSIMDSSTGSMFSKKKSKGSGMG